MRYTVIILVLILLNCNSNKNISHHNHGDYGHSHHTTNAYDDYFGSYSIKDKFYGTNTVVTVDGNTRTMVTNALPNHETGAFPTKGNPNTISAQKRTYRFPVSPKYVGKAQWVREPGVALNGVKFEPQTAEVVQCETGENYRVEAIQDVIDLGLDFNHAHVQPTGAYHYHGTPTSIIEKFDTGEDLVHIGFAQDGFPMYYSKSGRYKPSFKLLEGTREGDNCSYENPKERMDISIDGHHDGTYGSDFEYVEGLGDLDECNGISIDGKYMYLVTKEFPYIGRCVMGEISYKENQNTQGGPEQRAQTSPPNIDQLFAHMDNDKDGKLSKKEVKGPLQHDFDKMDTNEDGYLTREELENAPKPKRQRSQRRPTGGRF